MSNYFNQVPNFEYISRLPDAKIGDFITVKNLFKKGKIRPDIIENLAFFTKYDIKGDDRPDNVAFEVYGDSSLDWVILLSNNILNIQTEWPLPQNDFDEYVLDKYGDYDTLYNGIHHYESSEVRNGQGAIIVPAGLKVEEDFSISYYDYFIENGVFVEANNIAIPITNYEYEEKIENEKRNIFLLKPKYLNVIIDDMEDIMTYKKGATQYVSDTLKRGDNIRLYE
jgi:hypothetical protein